MHTLVTLAFPRSAVPEHNKSAVRQYEQELEQKERAIRE